MGGRQAIRNLAAGLTVAFTFAFSGAMASAESVSIIDEQKVSDRLLELTVETPAFTAPAKVHVFLPTGYDAAPTKKWPVTYFLAGTQNRYNSLANFLDGENLTKDFPSIIVSPDGKSGYWSDWYNGGSLGAPQYETYVVDHLIPLVDSRFRTIADRSSRAIFGISMGGYGSMSLAARNPEKFAAAATLSGAVDSNLPTIGGALSFSSAFDGGAIDAINGPRETEEVRWRSRNPVDLATNFKGMDVQVLTANGTLNPEIGEGASPNDQLSCVVETGVYEASTSLHDQLTAQKVDHLWKDYGAGCHTPQNFTREVLDTMARFEQKFADPVPTPVNFNFRSIDPQFSIWGWQLTADPARALEFLSVERNGGEMTFSGSGSTRVVTPVIYRGLKKVDVNGKATKVAADGRLRFNVDLGPAHTVQQFRPEAAETLVTRKVTFKPHALITGMKAKRVRKGIRVCARTLGGNVPKAKFKVGKRSIQLKLKAKQTCRAVKTKRIPKRLTIQGRDRFGHAVKASVKVKR